MPFRALKLFQPLRTASLALALAAGAVPHWAAAQTVTSFTVVNAVTGADIATHASSAQVSLAQTPSINIRANATGAVSVVFTDASNQRRIENTAPFAYMGNNGDVYLRWRPAAGTHTIRATAYSLPNGLGTAGATATFTLTALAGGPPSLPISRNEARHFLAKATFGPDEASVDALIKRGSYAGWIDDQFALGNTLHQSTWRAAWDQGDKTPIAGQFYLNDSFWKHALSHDNQLRQRVAFALSQIFVVSSVDGDVFNRSEAMAHWLDMLGDKGLTTYRELLEAVTLHPLMGFYLDSFQNQRPDGNGRVPDLNFAREITQLFSIGQVLLNQNGTVKLVDGKPKAAYTADDLTSLSHVFTGYSFSCPGGATTDACWKDGGGAANPARSTNPMQAYPAYYSLDEKVFFNQTIPARPAGATQAQQLADLKLALDTLASHPNTAPFISKQLIQRLVSSNPSKAYVRDVAGVFINNGAGVRGDMKAVVKAILTHREAFARSANASKVREPVLALSAYLRAFKHGSSSGRYMVGYSDDPATGLAQTPLRAPSVFNFYRPGYEAPNSLTAAAGLVAPELQIFDETSAPTWVNYMRIAIHSGLGRFRDLQRDWTEELALASDSAALAKHVTDRLLYGGASKALTDEIQRVVDSYNFPAVATDGRFAERQRNRVRAALLLTVASPEYLVQK